MLSGCSGSESILLEIDTIISIPTQETYLGFNGVKGNQSGGVMGRLESSK